MYLPVNFIYVLSEGNLAIFVNWEPNFAECNGLLINFEVVERLLNFAHRGERILAKVRERLNQVVRSRSLQT